MTRKALISPGFGAGWSTWADREYREDFLFDAALIEAVEARVDLGDEDDPATPLGGFAARMRQKHGAGWVGYLGGACDLEVQVIEGQFRVEEYDGSESVISRYDDEGWV